MTAPVAQRVVVRGRVQGVFFRDATRGEALSRRVAGWVANRDDGAVEAHFEGSPDAGEAMVQWCREGPRYAEVRDVRVGETEPEGLSGFTVR